MHGVVPLGVSGHLGLRTGAEKLKMHGTGTAWCLGNLMNAPCQTTDVGMAKVTPLASRPVINVGCAGNAKYALPIAVMLTSVVCNLKTDRDLHIYIIESDMDEAVRHKIEASVRQNKQDFFEVYFHWNRLDPDLVKSVASADNLPHLSSDAYSRLMIPEFLPADAEQLIYIDADIVVLADLATLSDAADRTSVLCAVRNVMHPYASSHYLGTTIVFNQVEMGIPADAPYFNSGLLVINLKPWREEKAMARVMDYLQRFGKKVWMLDQGGLNAVLYDRWAPLDLRWNQTALVLIPQWWRPPVSSREEWIRVKNDPYIVHYTGSDKPWLPGYRRPRLVFFARYLKRTLFKDDIKVGSLEMVVGYSFYSWMWQMKQVLHTYRLQLKKRFAHTREVPPGQAAFDKSSIN